MKQKNIAHWFGRTNININCSNSRESNYAYYFTDAQIYTRMCRGVEGKCVYEWNMFSYPTTLDCADCAQGFDKEQITQKQWAPNPHKIQLSSVSKNDDILMRLLLLINVYILWFGK